MAGRLTAWVERYERAWRTPGVAPLAELFTPDAVYSPAPFDDDLVGLDAIADFWETERDGPGEDFTLTAQVVAEQDDVGVARLEVVYADPHRIYRDLWVVTFAGPLARRFEEWPFFPDRGRVGP